ncbi:polysaccharide deacetylase family protein [Streptomyces sp. A7024]|uniref:Polysaccharide deacetylase family protein n=1 Tax=Streptomyces coryli TaxID=1128680 RepID=A0A6G4TYY0_9ACTN|nr:polysaccharide deacetylase family protein [Streptomyces coryli]NGN64237.1 polysaccharide deacetylase family protein [Streptomyces coryli]
MTRGALLLTFDDFFVPEWAAAREVVRAHGARVTFFVSDLGRLSRPDFSKLRDLAADGHTIGAHGLHHLDAAEEIARVGPEAYVRDEIAPCLAGLRAEGLAPRSFAYPFGGRSPAIDELLARTFTRLRGGYSAPSDGRQLAEDDGYFIPVSELPSRRLLTAAGADNGRDFRPCGNSDAALLAALRRAADRDEALTLYAHAIAEAHENNYITPARVTWLIEQATELGVRCIGFDDLDEIISPS